MGETLETVRKADNKIHGPIDFNKNEAQNLVIHTMTSAERAAMPTPKTGVLVYEEDTGELYLYSSSPATEEAWIAPTLLNSWVNYTSGNAPAGYYKDSLGEVHVTGLIKDGTLGQPFFVLPAGYRPPYQLNFPGVSNGLFIYLVVYADGTILSSGGSNVWVSLDSISFRAA